MSEPNENKKIPWGNREMSQRDFAFVFGFAALMFALAGGIIWYAVNNQPGDDAEVAQVTPEGGETAVATYPPLAPLPPVSFPPDNPYSEAKVELGLLLYFDPRFSGDGSISCNSCHPSSDGSWGVSSPISFGYPAAPTGATLPPSSTAPITPN